MRCICARCEPVHNRTTVHILQHPRERFHPFGTARIAELVLARVQVHVAFGDGDDDVRHPLQPPPGSALLYPSPHARDVGELARHELPRHLFVLDGTWRNARALYRDNPWLHALPALRIDPVSPSEYRIRKEPAAHCLSTVESIAQALSALEPDTPGMERLTSAFRAMIDAQIAHPGRGLGPPRRKRRRRLESRAVPATLRDPERGVVVVYGESSELSTRRDPASRLPLQWTALRVEGGESFERFVRPERGACSEEFLQRMGLGAADLEGALTPPELIRTFWDFLRPRDVLVAWNRSSLHLLDAASAGAPLRHERVLLKAVYANVRRRRPGMLEEVIAREGLDPEPLPLRGRAAQRLADAAAVLSWLKTLDPALRPGAHAALRTATSAGHRGA
jgi:hypothetical protein